MFSPTPIFLFFSHFENFFVLRTGAHKHRKTGQAGRQAGRQTHAEDLMGKRDREREETL